MTAIEKKNRFFLWMFGIVIGLIALFIFHPWLLGLPSRIGEIRFERGLHEGMPRAEVAGLMASTGGMGGSRWGESSQTRSEIEGGAMPIFYWDWGTICMASGDLVILRFDQSDHLRSWRIERWFDGC